VTSVVVGYAIVVGALALYALWIVRRRRV